MPGLGTSFGRGGATTAQQDLANADCILIEGSSMAEAHPVGFRWVMKAKERGATVIHVDPRFSRTSALADIWVPIRAGSDIAFLGALVRHIIENELFFREYVVHYTNASCILRDDYGDPEDNADGYFSGWNEDARNYSMQSWHYKGDDLSFPQRDLTLQDSQCVFQKLKRHFARYTPEMVEKVCGISPALFYKVADSLVSASGPEKTAAVCYAVGWTQHSKGVQIIRTASILQLLLGNIGRPGGGILALRGHASIQGSTDIPTLYDILPGYLAMPRGGEEETLQQYLDAHTPKTGLWSNTPSYFISLLKAYYGKHATAENNFGYNWLPKLTADHSFFEYLYDMADGKMEGMFLIGQNSAVGAPNSRLQRKSMAKLKWFVIRDMVETEPARFWRDSAEIERGELKTEEIETEVFFFPAAGHAEKEGAFTNTQRLLQWREKAVDPPGDCRSDAWFIHQLALRLIGKARAARDPIDEPLRALDWWYPEDRFGEPKMEAVLAEINGWKTSVAAATDRGSIEGVLFGGVDREGNHHHGTQIDGYEELKNDGSTACGCWIYSGVFSRDGVNKANSRKSRDYLGHGWGFSWPSDRRIIYNRASARPGGEPWSERKKLVWWDSGNWTGIDVPDFKKDKPPDYEPVPKGLQDGPMPTHYEPLESPVHNALYSRDTNPVVNWFTRAENRFAPPGDPRFPFVLTTYRLTEHHTGGGMSRFLSHLSELQPEMFVEVSPELASKLKIKNSDYVCIVSLRGAIEARALVSRRIRPMSLNGRTVHQVAVPFHFGAAGPLRGNAANNLVAISGEPNVTIMESKALTCNIVPGRLPRGPAFLDWIEQQASQSGLPPNLHPEQPPAGAPHGGRFSRSHGKEGKMP
ncbi:MAG: formate dehydrogenase [Verrucomicrobia bacterium]|nr:MAG: formate dehydrogenase [Verrucomicrobiota bacterium]